MHLPLALSTAPDQLLPLNPLSSISTGYPTTFSLESHTVPSKAFLTPWLLRLLTQAPAALSCNLAAQVLLGQLPTQTSEDRHLLGFTPTKPIAEGVPRECLRTLLAKWTGRRDAYESSCHFELWKTHHRVTCNFHFLLFTFI